MTNKSKNKSRRQRGKRHLPFVLLVFFVLFILGGVLFIASLPIFKITNVSVSSTKLISSEEVLRVAAIPVGDNIFFTSFKGPKKRISEIPIIKKVSIKRIIPSTVLVKIEERHASIVCTMKNQSLILDDDGVILNPPQFTQVRIEFPDITNLPVMSGLKEDWIENGAIKASSGKEILKLLSEFKNFVLPQKLQINISDQTDIKLLVDDILKVRIGNADKLRYKMDVFEAIYLKIKPNKNNIEYIDVSSPDFPVVRFF